MVLAEVVLVMRGPLVAEPHVFLLDLPLPPRLLPALGRDVVLRRGLSVPHCISRGTIAVPRAEGGTRLVVPLFLPQHAAQGTVSHHAAKISCGPRSVGAPSPSAQVQVLARLLGRRSG